MADGANLPIVPGGVMNVTIRDAKLADKLLGGSRSGPRSGVIEVLVPKGEHGPEVTLHWKIDARAWDMGRDEPKESA